MAVLSILPSSPVAAVTEEVSSAAATTAAAAAAAAAASTGRLFRRSRAKVQRLPAIHARPSAADVEVQLRVALAEGLKFTSDAESLWQILFSSESDAAVVNAGSWDAAPRGHVATATARVRLPSSAAVEQEDKKAILEIESRVFYCDSSDACRSDNRLFEIPVLPASADSAQRDGDVMARASTLPMMAIDFAIVAPPPPSPLPTGTQQVQPFAS